MRTKRVLTIFGVLTVLLALAVTLWRLPVAAQTGDPVTVVQTYLDAIIAKDFDAALAQVTDDVTHTDTHAPPGLPSVTQGKADFGAYLEGSLSDPEYRLEYTDLQADGDAVTWVTQEWFGIANLPPDFPLPIESRLTAVVTEGKIASILLENDPAWLEKLYAAIPPEAIDPASVVELWTKAFNAGDADALQAVMADDIALKLVSGAPDDPTFEGKEAVLAVMASSGEDHFTLEMSSFLSDGAMLMGTYSGIGDDIRAHNVGPEIGAVEALVEEGLIKTISFIIDPEFNAAYEAADAKLQALQGLSPIEIVQAAYDALAAGDLETMGMFYANDVVVAYPGGRFQGKDAMLTSYAGFLADGLRLEISNYREENGEVRYDQKVYFGDELVDEGVGVAIVEDGQIVVDVVEGYMPLETLPFLGSTALDPIAIVQTAYEAIANGDVDTVAALYADDVALTYPGGKIQGKDAALTILRAWIADGFHSENSNYRENNGEVRYDYKVFFGDELVDENTNGLTIVKDGEIIFDGLEEDKPQSAVAPLVGTWHVKIPGEVPFDAFWTFIADGTFVETSSELGGVGYGPAHGVWRQRPDGYELNFAVFTFDEEGQHSGMAKVYCQIQLESPDQLVAACPAQVLDRDGAVVFEDPVVDASIAKTIEENRDTLNRGTRLKVEPRLKGETAQSSDPVAVIQAFHAAQNAGDVEGMMALIAENAVFHHAPPSGATLDTPESIRSFWQRQVDSKTTGEQTNYQVTGDTVSWDVQLYRNGAAFRTDAPAAVVQDGKITAWDFDPVQ